MAAPILTVAAHLPPFSGEPDDEVQQFLARFDRYLALYPNMNAAQKLFHLENALTGSAAAMFRRKVKELLDTEPVPPRTPEQTYNLVREALAAAFPTVIDKQAYRDQLQTRIKQESESYAQYAQDVLRLCGKLDINEVDEQLQEIHKGVDLAVAAALRPDAYNTVDEFLRAVQNLETTHKAAIRAHTQYHLQRNLPPPSLASVCVPAACMPSALACGAFSAPAAPAATGTHPLEDKLAELIQTLERFTLAHATASAVQTPTQNRKSESPRHVNQMWDDDADDDDYNDNVNRAASPAPGVWQPPDLGSPYQQMQGPCPYLPPPFPFGAPPFPSVWQYPPWFWYGPWGQWNPQNLNEGTTPKIPQDQFPDSKFESPPDADPSDSPDRLFADIAPAAAHSRAPDLVPAGASALPDDILAASLQAVPLQSVPIPAPGQEDAEIEALQEPLLGADPADSRVP
ncbi:hypothetical protein ONE63_001655 [Megalurothrips usitatus]|uniref:Retrotransposon gag domain-containing protein n=1 Tax=Megalurothrips usitatus TaxID=439358 RepID=A0AAV7XDM5_9NEOP|nr:hypothetical protein ONE63_001655 [Megalurothrips usitatus]